MQGVLAHISAMTAAIIRMMPPAASSLRKREKNVSCVVLMDYLVFEALIGFEKFGAVLLLGNQNQCVQ